MQENQLRPYLFAAEPSNLIELLEVISHLSVAHELEHVLDNVWVIRTRTQRLDLEREIDAFIASRTNWLLCPFIEGNLRIS